MARIFLTGMNASQASEKSNSKNLGFAGLMHRVLTEMGHEVAWKSPSIYITDDELSRFDSVIVGIAPPTSLSTDRAYGALSIIKRLWDSGKLTLFVDSPTPSQIESSINSLINNPEGFNKPFFSYRREYSSVTSDKNYLDWLYSAVLLLKEESWVPTIYPRLPWRLNGDIRLPINAKNNLVGVNLDSFLINQVNDSSGRESWSYDLNSKWMQKMSSSTHLPKSKMKLSKADTDLHIYNRISSSIGSIISPDDRDGTYWNYRYIQAINSGTPVVTEWKESGAIGEAWMALAPSVEEMSERNRDILSLAQCEIYSANVGTKQSSYSNFADTIRISGSLSWIH